MLVGHHVYEFGPFRLDVGEGRLLRQGEPVRIAPKAFEFLAVLVARAGRVVTKDDLMAELWAGTFVEDGNLTVHVSTLRKLLGGDAGWIETVPRRGYRFVAPVRELLIEPAEVPLVVVPAPERRAPEGPRWRDERPGGPDPAAVVSPADVFRPPVAHPVSTTVVPAVGTAVAQPVEDHSTQTYQRTRRRRALLLGSAAALILVLPATGYLAARWIRSPGGSTVAIGSVVVMPFESQAVDGSQTYLEVGLPDALVARLERLRRLRVLPTAAVRVHEDPFEAAQRLGVDGVITGSVARDGDDVQVTVALSRVASRAIVWSGQFDERATSLIAVENEIAEAVVANAVSGATAAERAGVQRRETPNGDAYVLYLRALDQWGRRTPDAIRTAIAMYQQAIRLDPGFALAYAGLADAYAVSASGMPPANRFPLAKAAAHQALALDRQLAEAHTAVAFLDYKAEWQWDDADREFRRAIDLNPSYALAHHWYGEFLGLRGRYDEAVRQFEQARALDPYSVATLADYAEVLRKAGRLADSQAMLEAGLKIEPGAPLLNKWMGVVLRDEGNARGAIEYDLASRRVGGEAPQDLATLQTAFNTGGLSAYEHKYIALLSARRGRAAALPVGLASELAAAYASLHDKANTMKWLAAAATAHEDAPLELNSPDYVFLANDPSFEALKKRVGL